MSDDEHYLFGTMASPLVKSPCSESDEANFEELIDRKIGNIDCVPSFLCHGGATTASRLTLLSSRF